MNNVLKLCVRLPNSNYQFLCVWNDSSSTYFETQETCVSPMDAGTNGYLDYILNTKSTPCGSLNETVTNELTLNYSDVWGCKYTATKNDSFNLAYMYCRADSMGADGEVAIYYASNKTLYARSSSAFMTAGGHFSGIQWTLPMPFTWNVSVVAGVSYWICFETGYTGAMLEYNNETAVVNQTVYFPSGGLPNTFPDSIPASATYYNRSFSVILAKSAFDVLGFGSMVYSNPTASVAGSNGNFWCTWTSSLPYSLYGFYLETNMTGTPANQTFNSNSSLGFGTVLAYGNLTVTLNTTTPGTNVAIQWREFCNDSRGVWFLTAMQYLVYTPLAGANWASFVVWPGDVGKTLGQVNASMNANLGNWRFLDLQVVSHLLGMSVGSDIH